MNHAGENFSMGEMGIIILELKRMYNVALPGLMDYS